MAATLCIVSIRHIGGQALMSKKNICDNNESEIISQQLYDGIKPLFEQLSQLAETAVIQYKPLAEEIISGKITNEHEISHIMDGMLDFCNFDNMLILYKKVCRSLIYKYPQLTIDYIQAYRDTWDSE
jgi:hypothetical protein